MKYNNLAAKYGFKINRYKVIKPKVKYTRKTKHKGKEKYE